MNAGNAETQASYRLSWEPQDPVALLRRREITNTTLLEFASMFKDALIPGSWTVELWEEFDQGKGGDTIRTTSDPWVLKFGPNTDTTKLHTDGTWDGHTIQIQRGEKYYKYIVRSVWIETDNMDVRTGYLAVDHPIHQAYDGVYRIQQWVWPMPADVIDVVSGVRNDFGGVNIQIMNSTDAALSGMAPYAYTPMGDTWAVTVQDNYQEPAPTWTPVCTLTDNPSVWVGPEAPGKFQYCFTYARGCRSAQYNTNGGFTEFLWESGPSPESLAVTVPSNGSAGVRVSLPNVGWEQNFDPTSGLRNGHSGLWKLVYKRRFTATGNPSTFKTKVETPGVWQLVAIVRDIQTEWQDDGSVIPDRSRPLFESPGYRRLRGQRPPWRDDRYDFQVRRTPQPLRTDQDELPISSLAIPAFLDLLTYRLSIGLDKGREVGALAQADWLLKSRTLNSILQPAPSPVNPVMQNLNRGARGNPSGKNAIGPGWWTDIR